MLSLNARRELVADIVTRYRTASKSDRSSLIDDLVAHTQYNRKHAIYVLRKALLSGYGPTSQTAARRSRRRTYGPDVEGRFLALWRISGGLCPKRLMPFLEQFIEALERFDEISLCPGDKDKLLAMSVSTAERMLARSLRSREHGISTTTPGTLLRQQIPIRTYEDWDDAVVGFTEVDLVAHCGGTASGDYLYTLTVTDICTGWTERIALPNRGQSAVRDGIVQVRKLLPFALRGIDCDNGGEFINFLLAGYCLEEGIDLTRGRPYKKNDQCHVEQKNGATVRPVTGYARYEGQEAVAYLNRLYARHRLSLNFFEPSMKLISKSRQGARVKKTYDSAKTPWERLQAAKCLSPEAEERLRQQYLRLNPAQLRRDIEELEMGLRRFGVDSPAVTTPQNKVVPQGQSKRNVTIAGPNDQKKGANPNGPAA
jgi:hypothetical protein